MSLAIPRLSQNDVLCCHGSRFLGIDTTQCQHFKSCSKNAALRNLKNTLKTPTFAGLFTEYKFHVGVYKNADKVGRMGVILYTCRDRKKVVVCCNDRLEIHPVEMVSRI